MVYAGILVIERFVAVFAEEVCFCRAVTCEFVSVSDLSGTALLFTDAARVGFEIGRLLGVGGLCAGYSS